MFIGVKIKMKVASLPHTSIHERITNAIKVNPSSTTKGDTEPSNTWQSLKEPKMKICESVIEKMEQEMGNQETEGTLKMTAHVGLLKEGQEKVMGREKQKADKLIVKSKGLEVGK